MDAPGPRRPQSLLFMCSENAVRSPMAEGLARQIVGRDIYVASAGVRAGELDPFAVAAMAEFDIGIARHRPHVFEDLDDTSFDVIVTLSPEAHHWALELTRTMAIEVIYWPTADPTAIHGSRAQKLDAYREVRDGLWSRIHAVFGKGKLARAADPS